MKIVDQIYHCQMPGQVFGVWQLQCHLRIFQPHSEGQATNPQWKAIAPETAQALINEKLLVA
jgi:hypothetical protein